MLPILIQGPTASGKSMLAVGLSKALGGIVLNADSMQVYRDLQVLSARPTQAEMSDVPHGLYGEIDGAERYGVGRWLANIEQNLAFWQAEYSSLIFCGGTGLYLKALNEGLIDTPEISEETRLLVRRDLARMGIDGLKKALLAKNTLALSHLTVVDQQRLLRAAEVLYQTGQPMFNWFKETAPALFPKVFRIVLLPSRESLYTHIDARCQQMIEPAKAEVSALNKRNLDASLPVMRCLGVSQLKAIIEGRGDPKVLSDDFAKKTRHYAKRQRTWLRHQVQADFVIEDFVYNTTCQAWCEKILRNYQAAID